MASVRKHALREVKLRPVINLQRFGMHSKPSQNGEHASVEVTEGSAKVEFAETKVFYNEVQVKNRDLSVLVINEYANQLVNEAQYQKHCKENKIPWRHVPPTKNTWGKIPVPENKAHVAVDKVKPEDLHGLFILEALGASGLRSLRYSNEITSGAGVDKILYNDLEEAAVDSLKKNLSLNSENAQNLIETNNMDANLLMMMHRDQPKDQTHTHLKSALHEDYVRNFTTSSFDIIDLDPYGSASIFMDAAVQSVRDGGLLCITCTDLASMCGKNMFMCYTRYGAMPMKKDYAHEQAIRIILGKLDRDANLHGRYIVPLMSVKMDFYVRVFVRVYTNKKEVHRAATRQGMIHQSSGCDSFYIQPLAREGKEVHKPGIVDPDIPKVCPETGEPMHIGGPIWTDPIHNFAFVKALANQFTALPAETNPYLAHMSPQDQATNGEFHANNLTVATLLKGLIGSVLAELEDVPLYYTIQSMARKVKTSVPPNLKIHSAIVNAGYRVSQCHHDPAALKTDAPPEFMWDVMRAWAHSTKGDAIERLAEDDPMKTFLQKPPTYEINLAYHPTVREKQIKRKREMNDEKATAIPSRWHANPMKGWGPRAAASSNSSLQTHKRPLVRPLNDSQEPTLKSLKTEKDEK